MKVKNSTRKKRERKDQRRLGNLAGKLELGFERWVGIGPLQKCEKDSIEGMI